MEARQHAAQARYLEGSPGCLREEIWSETRDQGLDDRLGGVTGRLCNLGIECGYKPGT